MRTIRVYAALLAIACSGCANLTTIGRSTILPGPGIAVHLDAPQRIAVINKDGFVCAEPSPDALQAASSSFGLGFSAPTKEAVSLAQSLSANAGSFGLRTQSITLMRDGLYRICELYFNKAITKEQVTLLMERSQDLTLAVLAIEQLTGAVVAKQVILNTSSGATAASSINDTQKELDRAKADEVTKQTAADAAKTALDAQKKVVADKTSVATDAKTKAKDTQAAIDKLSPALIPAEAALTKAIGNRLDLRLEVIPYQIQFDSVEAQLTRQKTEAASQRTKAADAEKAYQSALEKASKEPRQASEQKILDDLDAARKAALSKEAAANQAVITSEVALVRAQKDLVDAKAKEKAADGPVDAAQRNVDVINAQLKSLHDDPNQAAAETAIAAQKAATEAQSKKQTALEEATKDVEQAKANSTAIAKLGNTATASSNATGSGTGSFSTTTDRYGVSKDTVDALASATTEIVKLVVNKGHLTDTCALMLMNLANEPEKLKLILPLCSEVVSAAVATYRINAGKTEKPGDVTPLFVQPKL